METKQIAIYAESEVMPSPILEHYGENRLFPPAFERANEKQRRVVQAELSGKCPFSGHEILRYKTGNPLDAEFNAKDTLCRSANKFGFQEYPYVAMCKYCGYWFGRGTMSWGHSYDQRLFTAIIRTFHIDSLDIPVKALVRHLVNNTEDLLSINPFKAEEVVCDLLSEQMGSEVIKVGGRRDRGVDGYFVVNGLQKTLIQVKWRRDNRGGEGVRVVRELVGTLIAQGQPSGLLVTTKDYLTRDAMSEIADVVASNLTSTKLNLEYKTYSTLIEMLELRLSDRLGSMTLPEIGERIESLDVLG